MAKKKILIINYHSAPSALVGAKRFTFLSHIFQNKNIDCHFLAPLKKYYQRLDQTIQSAGKTYQSKMIPPFPIENNSILVRIFKRLWRDYLCLIDPYSGWVLPGIMKALKIVENKKIDLVIISGPPFSPAIIGYLLNLKLKVKIILDYRDPWSNFEEGSKRESFLKRKLNRAIEKLVIRKASAFVFCSEIMAHDFHQQFTTQHSKITKVITNGIHQRTDIEPLHLERNKTVLIYAGDWYGGRKFKLIAEPIKALLEKGVINKKTFCFYVLGHLNLEDRELIRKYGLHEIIIEHRQVEYKTFIRYLHGADILLLISGLEVRYAIPMKIFDYISTKKPIFAIAPQGSAVANMMHRIDCGRVANINDQKAIQKTLETLVMEKEQFSFAGVERYHWEYIAKEYMELINQVC